MRKKNITLSLVFLLAFALLSVNLVSATVTLVNPAGSSTMSGVNYTYNVSFSDEFTNPTNCTLWGKSSATANSTYVRLNTTSALNITSEANWITGNVSTLVLEDSNLYEMIAMCYNGSLHQENSSSNKLIIIDNTVPTTPTSLLPATDSVDEDGSVTFSVSVTDSRTTGCTLYFVDGNPGSSSYSMVRSGSSYVLTLPSMADQTYTWYAQASDGTNTTDSGQNRINVDVSTSAGVAGLHEYLDQQGLVETSDDSHTFSIVNFSGNGIGTEIAGIPIWVMVLIISAIVVAVVVYKRK